MLFSALGPSGVFYGTFLVDSTNKSGASTDICPFIHEKRWAKPRVYCSAGCGLPLVQPKLGDAISLSGHQGSWWYAGLV